MTLHSFLTQIGTLLLVGALALLALRLMNRRFPDAGTGGSSGQASPRPFTRLPVGNHWTPEQCAEVFKRLATGEEIHFFAADVPSPSDPGGYVTVKRDAEGHLIRTVGNHGWSSAWKPVSLTEMQDELYRNRAVQTIFIQGQTVQQAYRMEKVETR